MVSKVGFILFLLSAGVPEVACGGGGLFSGCRLTSWVNSAALFPSVQLEIMGRFFVHYILIGVKCIFCF